MGNNSAIAEHCALKEVCFTNNEFVLPDLLKMFHSYKLWPVFFQAAARHYCAAGPPNSSLHEELTLCKIHEYMNKNQSTLSLLLNNEIKHTQLEDKDRMYYTG
jgi:hypothetical protein